jgi:hypothetical protein
MATRQRTDKELTDKFCRLYGKPPTVGEFLQFKKNYPHPISFKEEKPDDRKQIPVLETDIGDSVFLDD